MKEVRNKKLFDVDADELKKAGVSSEEFNAYFPRHIREQRVLECGPLKYAAMETALRGLRFLVNIALRPRKETPGELDIKEVECVYEREARTYDLKHHLTTRGMDTVWRRMAGNCVATYARNNGKSARVLDLCTGTGLTIAEMLPILNDWEVEGSITGVDFCENMLKMARRRKLDESSMTVTFARGDAMNLAGDEPPVEDGLTFFEKNSFDLVTQMCGIGGVCDPVKVFRGVLEILAPGGMYFLSDIHRPIHGQSGDWPVLALKWIKFPVFEVFIHEEGTAPILLNRLWGWRETTLDFYLAPLVAMKDEKGKCWGFRVNNFETTYQRWWLGFPWMRFAKTIVEKVEISEEERDKRETILSMVVAREPECAI